MKIELSKEEIRLLIISLNLAKDYNHIDELRESVKLRSKLMGFYDVE